MKRAKIGKWRSALSLAVVALVLALSSCTKEPMLPGEQLDKEYLNFSLELTPPGAFTPAQTRAMTPDDQNAINHAEVLIFKNNILLYHKSGIITGDGVIKRVKVTLKTSQTESDLFDIMVIGNPPSGFNFDAYVDQNKDKLKTDFTGSSNGKWSNREFMMYGEILQTLIKPTTNNFKIQMLRSLARVDLGVGAYNEATGSWAGLGDTFTLTTVYVVNSRIKFAVIPSATILSSTGNVKVDTPTIPSPDDTATSSIIYYDDDIDRINGKGRSIESTIFIAEAPNTTDRVTLLVGGSYMGDATTFYRIDFCLPRAGVPGSYDYLNILRNHLYRISITGVSGEGFDSAQKALISAPINITTTLDPIEEGGSGGDIIFDGNNYLMTDASEVQIYGYPNGAKTYPIVTVKANFVAGVKATVTGPGISTINLDNGVSQTISAVLPSGATAGSYMIKVGRLTKVIPFTVKFPIDAHFEMLPFKDVASISTDNVWLTLSQNSTYKPAEQRNVVTGNTDDKAYIHIDENLATTGAPRMGQAMLQRNNAPGLTTRVVIEQYNLKGCVLGYFGGKWGDDLTKGLGYTKQLAMEQVEEFGLGRVYDDDTMGPSAGPMPWGFLYIQTDAADIEFGQASTNRLATRDDHGVGPLTPTNTFAARYCYDKNRDTNGNGTIDDAEVVWYLPAKNQLLGVWIALEGMQPLKSLSGVPYWSATECFENNSWGVNLGNGHLAFAPKKLSESTHQVRCVREL